MFSRSPSTVSVFSLPVFIAVCLVLVRFEDKSLLQESNKLFSKKKKKSTENNFVVGLLLSFHIPSEVLIFFG